MSLQNKLFFTVCLLQTVSCIQSSESDIRPKAADPMLHEKQRHRQIDLGRLYQLSIAHVAGERFSGDDAATPTYHQSRLRNIDKRIMGLAEEIDDLHNPATLTGKDFAHLSMQNQERKLMNLWEQLELAQQYSRILRKQQMLAILVAKFAKTQPIPAAPTDVKHQSSACFPKAQDRPIAQAQANVETTKAIQPSISTEQPSTHVRQSFICNFTEGELNLFTPRPEY